MKQFQYIVFTTIFILILMAVETAYAATFTIINTNDTGAGSLRQAILDANVNNEEDTINFDSTVFSSSQTIVLTTGQLTVLPDNSSGSIKALTIQGAGANLLTITGNNQSRVLFIDRNSKVVISGVKITGGNGTGEPDPFGMGGGILVYPSGSPFVLKDSIVSGNKSLTHSGGGLQLLGEATIINTAIFDNTSINGGAGVNHLAPLRLINSTVSNNTSTNYTGAGIFNNGSYLYLTNSTVAYNRIINHISGIQVPGIGTQAQHNNLDALIYLKNSIIANNILGDIFSYDIYNGHIVSEGFNIIGKLPAFFNMSGNTTGNQLNTDPQLDPVLRNNGGIIPTHALLVNSTAIDRGDNCVLVLIAIGGCMDTPMTTDQRGAVRPQDGDGDGTATVDVGAFEITRQEVTSAPDLQSTSDSGSSDTDNITASVNRSFNINGVTVGATVELLRDGVVVASGIANSNSIILSDNTTAEDGVRIYASRQIINGVISSQRASVSVKIDTAAPTFAINQAIGQADPTNTQPIKFTVIFNEEVNGFDSADVSLNDSTAGISSANVTVTGSGKTFTVTVNNISAGGSVIARILPNSVKDIAGNSSLASTSTDNSVVLDATSPIVTINQAAGQIEPTKNLPVNFTVVFSESVTGFNNADILLSGSTANVSSASVTVTGSGNIYNISISNVTSNGGFVMASVRPQAATDAAGNPNEGSTSTDNAVIIDNTSPTVTINQGAKQSDPTNTLPINFTVVFSEPVTGFDAADINFNGSTVGTTGAGINVTGSGMIYNVAISNITSNGGSIRVNVRSSAASDAAGNTSLASTSTDNQVAIDNVAPTVTINQAIGQSDPAFTLPISFTVVFNEAVTGFDLSDVSLEGSTADISSATITVTGSGNVYTVSIRNIKSNGQVRASILAGAAQDLRGNLSRASVSSDNTITVNVRRALFDFDGDGKSDFSIYRPEVGEWWYLKSSVGGNTAAQFGTSTDKIVPGDYTGDGKTDFAFYRNGEWFVLRSEDFSYYAFPFGLADDIPVPADYDGDGKTDAAVYRPSTKVWYILNSSGSITIQVFGGEGDMPVPADYNGDGKADMSVYNSSTNVYKMKTPNGEAVFIITNATGKLVPADYNGDGKVDIAFYDQSTNKWFIVKNDTTFDVVQFGAPGDIPAPADYDGDGKTDLAIYRPSTNHWWYAASASNGTHRAIQFGISTDIPLPNAYIR